MKAVVVDGFGGPERLRLAEVPDHRVVRERTRRLASLVDSGVLRPVVSRVLPLSEAAQAHRILESGHSGGKIVLAVGGSAGG